MLHRIIDAFFETSQERGLEEASMWVALKTIGADFFESRE